MIAEPQGRISERALKVWRITNTIYFLILFIIAGVIIGFTYFFHWPVWLIWLVLFLLIVDGYFSIYYFPLLKWKRWRYEVREQEIEIKQGVFIIKRTLVPMIRVQHVDTKQGPILKKYQLATVTVATAATIHEIPALELEEAEELRIFISRLARVADEDV